MNAAPASLHVSCADISLHHQGIISVTVAPGTSVSVDMLEEVVAAHKQLAPDRQSPVLYHITPKPPFDPDILGMVKRRDVRAHVSAVAAIVSAAPIRHAANAFLGFIDSPFPIRLFDDEAAAIAWLQNFLPDTAK